MNDQIRPTPRKMMITLTLGLFCFAPGLSNAQLIDVWVGTGGPAGIHHLHLNANRGTLSQPRKVADISGSGFLAMHPNGKVLYATAKVNGEGGVAAFQIQSNTEKPVLKPLNTQLTGDGGAACIAVDKTGQVLLTVQYGGGSVTSYKLNEDGSIGERVSLIEHGKGSNKNPKRQATAHPHWAGSSPDNRFIMVPDLGMDRVVVYELDPDTAKLTSHSKVAVPPGSGPRHMKFHPNGKYAYVLNELTLTVSSFRYEAESGKFEPIEVVETLPNDKKDKHLNSAAEIRVHPSGDFIYTSNRGHDSITVFSVDMETGKLSLVEREHVRGSWPRNFNLDPSGSWLIAGGQKSNTLALFEVDSESGELIFSRNMVNSPSPICVLFESE